jgi:hypothetical protein
MVMKKILLLLLLMMLGACAIQQAEIPMTSSVKLCDFYSKPMSPNYFDPAIREELVKRGHAECTTPAAMAARRQADMQMLNLSQQLLDQSQPRVLAPSIAPPSQFNCVSRQQGSQVITNCN